ncbi:MAG: hypothetical protein H6708_22315 [Kofleriaceae bacterium]|nr:hypothetical protein [Myxococcales bacterium]MCB9563141.1 hypothetical protein [Kofleriaceae bacterium]
MASNQQNQSAPVAVASCVSGLLGWVRGLFGPGTPTYAGRGQPTAARCGWSLFGNAPTYQVAPPEQVVPQVPAVGATDPQRPTADAAEELVVHPIAIVIRREPSPPGDGQSAS